MSKQTNSRVPIRRIIADLLLHLLSAVISVALIYIATRSLVYAGIFVIGAVLVDVDHLVDYFLYCRSKFRIKDLLSCCYLDSGKVYLFLHSWEVNFLVLIWALFAQSPAFWILFLGLSVHLIIDNLQRRNPFFYFITYRLYNKFDSDFLLPEHRRGGWRF